MNLKSLSKTISYALRHGPQDFGLVLDPEGWVSIDALIQGISSRGEGFSGLTIEHIHAIMAQAEKQRFEIQGNEIRAFYGHSMAQKVEKTPQEPPALLFHGTSTTALPIIRESGIAPMSRQYVHLSTDKSTAVMVGSRVDRKPPILVVRAKEAWDAGILFYHGNQDTWLADPIPPQFIDFPA